MSRRRSPRRRCALAACRTGDPVTHVVVLPPSPFTARSTRRPMCEVDGRRMASVAREMVARGLPCPWRVYRVRKVD